MFYRSKNWTTSLIDPKPFTDADHHFLSYALQDQRYQHGLSGACFNVVHIKDKTIMTANGGDCRAVIGRRVTASDGSVSYRAIALSEDHQIDTNPSERERLLSQHPNEEDIISKSRVKGRLQPTRGLGDGTYKRIEYYQQRPNLQRTHPVWNPPVSLQDLNEK